MKSMQTNVAGLALLMTLTACGGGGSGTQAVDGSSGPIGSAAPSPAPAPGSTAAVASTSTSTSTSAATPAPAPAGTPDAGTGTGTTGTTASAPSSAPTASSVVAGPQSSPQVAPLANGGHVDVWTSGDGGRGVVYAQIYDASGQPTGSPVAVFGDGSASGWIGGGVAGLPDGSFVVAASAAIGGSGPLQQRLYAQKVSASGQLVATGGNSDAGVNGGLAARLLSEDASQTLELDGGPVFANPDGGFTVSVTRLTQSGSQTSRALVLLNVDQWGYQSGAAVNLSDGYVSGQAPVIARLVDGDFIEAGSSTNSYSPVVWKIVTRTGQVVALQSLGAAPGNATGNPQVAALADGTALVTYTYATATTTGVRGFRVDSGGHQVGSGFSLSQAGRVTGLSHGGFVQTWTSGSQLLAQYFNTSGQAAGDAFVLADNVETGGDDPYAIMPTGDGFVVAYQGATGSGQQVQEKRLTAPSLN